MATKGTLRAYQCEQTILCRVEGWAQMDLGLTLRRLGEKGLASGAKAVLVDLQKCAYMDSTFLGTLLFLKRAADRQAGCAFFLVSPSVQCCQLLGEMGLNDVFTIHTKIEHPSSGWTPLCTELNDAEAFQRNVLHAHAALATLPGRTGEAFKKVARLLEEDLEAKAKTWTDEKLIDGP